MHVSPPLSSPFPEHDIDAEMIEFEGVEWTTAGEDGGVTVVKSIVNEPEDEDEKAHQERLAGRKAGDVWRGQPTRPFQFNYTSLQLHSVSFKSIQLHSHSFQLHSTPFHTHSTPYAPRIPHVFYAVDFIALRRPSHVTPLTTNVRTAVRMNYLKRVEWSGVEWSG